MVSFREGLGDLLHNLYRSRNDQGLSFHQFDERLAFNQFHYDIRLSLSGLSVIVDVGYVLVRECRDGARFAQKAGAKMLITRTALAVQGFDGDATLQYAMRVEVPGEFRIAPARAELMYQPTVQANTANDRLRILDKK